MYGRWGGRYNRGVSFVKTEQVATVGVDGNEADHGPAAAERDPPAASRAALRFVYAGGARPLAGYTIKRGVGQGGFGEIYYAVSDAGKEVALKLIRRNLDVEVRGIRQCLNLKHPHLLSLYDIREDDKGEIWVVMEYIAGQCLEQTLLAPGRRVSPRPRRWPGFTASARAWPTCTTTASCTAT